MVIYYTPIFPRFQSSKYPSAYFCKTSQATKISYHRNQDFEVEAEDRKHICPVEGCGETFRTRMHVIFHQRNRHPGYATEEDKAAALTCTHCSKPLSRPDALKRHRIVWLSRTDIEQPPPQKRRSRGEGSDSYSCPALGSMPNPTDNGPKHYYNFTAADSLQLPPLSTNV